MNGRDNGEGGHGGVLVQKIANSSGISPEGGVFMLRIIM